MYAHTRCRSHQNQQRQLDELFIQFKLATHKENKVGKPSTYFTFCGGAVRCCPRRLPRCGPVLLSPTHPFTVQEVQPGQQEREVRVGIGAAVCLDLAPEWEGGWGSGAGRGKDEDGRDHQGQQEALALVGMGGQQR